MDFSVSIVHIPIPMFVAVLALFSATAAGVNATNATVTALTGGRSTGSLPAAANGASQQYTCYLCHKRKTMMVRRCPIANDDCHVACLSLPSPSTPPAPGGGGGARGDDDCYVMKLYPDRSWVVVDVVSCRSAGGCFLKCTYDAPPSRDEGADGTTPAPMRGTAFMPTKLPSFERCGQ